MNIIPQLRAGRYQLSLINHLVIHIYKIAKVCLNILGPVHLSELINLLRKMYDMKTINQQVLAKLKDTEALKKLSLKSSPLCCKSGGVHLKALVALLARKSAAPSFCA